MRYEQPSPETEAETETAPVSIVDAYLNAWRRVFDYTGVSTRREYWVFILAHWLLLFPVIGFSSAAWFFEENWATQTLAGNYECLCPLGFNGSLCSEGRAHRSNSIIQCLIYTTYVILRSMRLCVVLLSLAWGWYFIASECIYFYMF